MALLKTVASILAAFLFRSIPSGACPTVGSFETPETALTNVPFGGLVTLIWETPVPDLNGTEFNYVVSSDGEEVLAGSFDPLADGSLSPFFSWGNGDSTDFTGYADKSIRVMGNGWHDLEFKLELPSVCTDEGYEDSSATASTYTIPAWTSTLPALVVVIMTLFIRQVLFALFVGVAVGAGLLNQYNFFVGILYTLRELLPASLGDFSHASIVLFVLMFGGMVALICKSGGAAGLADVVVTRAKNSRHGMLAAWSLSLCIFFDDYANVLIVGNTVRKITDHLMISREKLAFLVDATAAPMVSIAPLSTWVGFEVGLIQDQFDYLGIEQSAYATFIETITMRAYPILIICFGLCTIIFAREQFWMKKAEQRARGGQVVNPEVEIVEWKENVTFLPKEGVKRRWYNAVIPIVSVILVVFVGLCLDGYYVIKDDPDTAKTITNFFNNADSYAAMMWGGFVGLVVPVLLYWPQKILHPAETLFWYVEGIKDVFEAILILILAWAVGDVCRNLYLADWLADAVGDSLDVRILPCLVFILSALIALATGSSWSTMTILFPIAVPLAYNISDGDMDATTKVIANVLAGSIVGDHVSPISDTTVLTSASTRCSVPDHVRTQMPYALIVAIVSIVVSVIPVGYSVYPSWAGLLIGVAIIAPTVRFFFTAVEVYYPPQGLRASIGEDSVVETDPALLPTVRGSKVSRASGASYKGMQTPDKASV